MYGIIAEDDSDINCLKVLIRRLSDDNTLTIKGKGYKGCGNMVRDGWKQLKVYNKLGINRFIICYDKDEPATQKRYQEVINEIIKPAGIKKDGNKICILIPTEEIEAWILADIKAVAQVITSWIPPEKDKYPYPEQIKKPKEELTKLLGQAKNSKPLYDYVANNEKVMKHINLEIVKKKCPSFAELHEFVKNDIANYPKNKL